MNQRIEIADYHPEWPKVFARLRDDVARAAGRLARRIEHVGSTAVPGLAAKPIIDLDVVIGSRADLPAIIERPWPLGYEHEGDLGIRGREAFTTPLRTPAHHLYVCDVESDQLRQHLAFRDHLRAHPEAVAT